MNLNRNELTILLAVYYFDYKKLSNNTLKNISKLFYQVFERELSPNNILYYLIKYKNIDPSFKANKSIPQSIEKELWEYFIIGEREKELKQIYKDFKLGKTKSTSKENVADVKRFINNNFNTLPFTFVKDKPKQKYVVKNARTTQNRERDPQVVFNALKLTGYRCEYSQQHKSFIRCKTNLTYTEGHHLIPLKFQDLFKYNLDVEANVVSLCSECHNQLHYGRDKAAILKKLYNERSKRLSRCGIKITFDKLLKLYEER